jgi:hypothetical protein
MTSQVDPRGTDRARRLGQTAALFVAPWCFVLSNAGYAWTARHGTSDMTAKGALGIAAAYPSLGKWSTFAALVGSLLLVPAVLGAMSLLRVKATRLGLVAGALVISGYICYFGLVFQDLSTTAIAQHGGATTANVALLDASQNQPLYVGTALTFVLGNIVGTFLLGVALFRARVVPRWAAVCVMAWPVAHIVGGNVGEVVGSAIEAVGLAAVGVQVLRGRRVVAEPAPSTVATVAATGS